MTQFGWSGVGLRFLFAILIVFATYNPEKLSFYHWAIENFSIEPLKVIAGIVLLIGWVIYIRATIRSLGIIGMILVTSLCASFIWLFVDWGWITKDSSQVISYIALFVISIILTTGMSWSHIRRRMSGQADMDDVTEDEN